MSDRMGPTETAAAEAAAAEVLRGAQLRFGGEVVGTVAACDPGPVALNYRECFVRDFAVSAAALLAAGRADSVRAFIVTVAGLQVRAGADAGMRAAPGLMPASFAVARGEGAGDRAHERIVADFGQRAIGRVAPIDAALWWLLILRAYRRATGDEELQRAPEVRGATEGILSLYLQPQFEMLPSLLVPDGSAMIDRRMGVYGHPLDVQVLFWAGLRAACEVLDASDPLRDRAFERLVALGRHLRRNYWLDRARIEVIRRYPVEEFGDARLNPWNLHPDAIPTWTMAWLSEGGGYYAGNLGPARLDPRFFALGNLLAVSTGLAPAAHADGLFSLIERHERDLLGETGVKLAYPPVEGRDWALLTGSDQKNVPWSYHNGGSWPMLLWPLASAARVAGRADLARRVLASAVPRLQRDDWPEYYDGPYGGLIGRRARLRQTWSAAAALAATALLRDPEAEDPFAFPRDDALEAAVEGSDGPADDGASAGVHAARPGDPIA
jgi:hypothetical protein